MSKSNSRNFSIPIRIYIEDTDAGGIVYYVNYLKFFERARTELFRQLGYDKAAFIDDTLMFVVHGLTIKYIKPARLDEQLQATAKVIHCRRTAIVFEQQICRDQQTLAAAEVTIACVDKQSMRPKAIPADILSAIDYNSRV